MQDEFERTGESPALSSARVEPKLRFEMLDVEGAIAAAERAAGSKVLGDTGGSGDVAAALSEASSLAARSERAALIAPAERLASTREAMRKVASSRHGIVAHAVAGHGAEELSALADLGWGVLAASGPEDSFDLSLVARRAAEDSGVPFIVVHGLGRGSHPAGRAVAMVGLPNDRAVAAFVGASSQLGEGGAAAAAAARATGDRSYAERVPFALGAALREYGNVSGRRHDAFDKAPLGESPLVLVGIGPVGDALFCATSELRSLGYDVGAVQITALRPFPGPRLVKALARALAITILEPVDEPLAHGALLARDLKSAFTDALTWVPGFPGIGRIPKLFVGATGSAFDVSDLAAVCENMLADERGRRVFSFVDVDHALPRATRTPQAAVDARPEREVAFRFVLDDVASAETVLAAVGATLVRGVGLRAHGIVTAAAPGASAVLDILASRTQARGGMARRAPRLVLATAQGVTNAGAVVPLPDGAVLGILGGDPSGALPEAARTVVRERRARVLPLATGESGITAVAAAAAGAALAAAARAMRTNVDPAEAGVIVAESVLPDEAARKGTEGELAAQRARRAFEATRDMLAAAVRPDGDGARPVGVA
jgi:pyruvate-ferredoxin/flavodoxin oxidoreductase